MCVTGLEGPRILHLMDFKSHVADAQTGTDTFVYRRNNT